MSIQKATLAAGCFWGIQSAFDELPGVISTTVGYCGGHGVNPSYEQVCFGTTGYAESVQIVFDSEKISYSKLLDLFWHIHDPTQMNRQGPDIGSQYRSVIFYHSLEQKQLAEQSKQKLAQSKKFSKPIVTEIVEFKEFFPAEEYHQKYLQKNNQAVC
ncbi:MAG: peptide-methionine (S)-S-oxide reductase MsrA [Candidatus Diapherotrites archaeon]|nr:peptide-methionine (S)-S-oxide reductase MsrA [Candidatus Diapherotrites archaeon]